MRSFEELTEWLKDVREKADKSVSLILLANKCDLLDQQVDPNKAIKLAKVFRRNYG